jgi:hypothetical protein
MCPVSPLSISSCYPHYQQRAIFTSTSHARLEELTSTNRSRRPSSFIEDTRKRHISMEERAGGTANFLIVIDLLSLATLTLLSLSLALSLTLSRACARALSLRSVRRSALALYAYMRSAATAGSCAPLALALRYRSAYRHSPETGGVLKTGSCLSEI